MTLEELKRTLCDWGHEDAVVLENPDFANAVVGVSDDGRVIYDYEMMVDCLAEEDEMNREDAIDFINYNTVRALPYMGAMRPIIMYGMEA